MSTPSAEVPVSSARFYEARGFLLAALALTLVNQRWLLPGAQRGMNSHLSFVGLDPPGPLFGRVFALGALCLCVRAATRYAAMRDARALSGPLGMAVCLAYWSHRFFALVCEGCARSG